MSSVHETVPVIPDYELVRRIGRGAYGEVWLARSVTSTFRAIKIVWRSRFTDPRPYEREFEGIMRFTAISLREPSQLALLHVGRDAGADCLYYVMELADDADRGRDIDPECYTPLTLQEMLHRRGRLPADEVVHLGVALASALATLHAAGMVHRDVKPSNIIFVGGVPKLADVGLVALARAGLTFVGTEGYVPPEGPGAPAADVYSLGKVLYQLATGQDLSHYPRLPPQLAEWPDRARFLELNAVILRAGAPNLSHRFADAGALREEMLLLQAGKSVRRLRLAEGRMAQAVRVAVALATLAGVAGIGAALERERANRESGLRAQVEAQRDDLARKSVYSATLESAQRALETNELGRARRRLRELLPQAGAPDLRNFEWHALWHEAQGDPAEVLRAGGPLAQRACFSPDGRLIASQSSDQVVTVWEAATRRELRRIDQVFRLAGFSADGRWLVGVNRQTGIQRWSVATGEPEGPAIDEQQINRPIGVVGPDRLVCFTEGRSGAPHRVRTWDFLRHAESTTWLLPPDAAGAAADFYCAAATADGARVALVTITGRAQNARWRLFVVELASGRILHREDTSHRIAAVQFAPDGATLAAAFADTAEIGLLDIAGAAWRWQVPAGVSQTNSLAFSPDGKHLALGGRDSVLRILTSDSGAGLGALRGQEAGITDVSWDAAGRTLVSAGTAGDVRLWPRPFAGRADNLSGLWRPAGGGRKVCLADDGTLLVATDAPERGTLVAEISDPSAPRRLPAGLLPLGFEPGSDRLFGLLDDGTLQRWQLQPQPALLAAERLFDEPIALGSSATLSADRTLLVVGTTDGQILFRPLDRSQPAEKMSTTPGVITFVALSPDGRHGMAGRSGNRVCVIFWSSDAPLKPKIFRTPGRYPTCGAFTPDGRYALVGWTDGSVEIRRPDSGEVIRTISIDSPLVQSLAVSADGARVACGTPGGTIHILATDDWREVLALRATPLPGAVADMTASSLAFSANDQVLAAYLNDGRIRIWRR